MWMHCLEDPPQSTHWQKVEWESDSLEIHVIAATPADVWDCAACDVGPILREVTAGGHPEWKDIANHSLTCRGYWAQWNSLVLLEHQWMVQTAHIVLPWSKVRWLLGELHGGSSRGHLGKWRRSLGTRWRWVVGFMSCSFTSGGTAPAAPCIGGWVAQGLVLDAVEKKNTSCPWQESSTDSSVVQPILVTIN
jgi:hypothetical protein